MSTRCQIQFQIGDKKVTIYRHNDGEPEYVVKDLKRFLKWNKGRNGDIEYMTANFVWWSKSKIISETPEQFQDGSANDMRKLGIGICPDHEPHDDIAFYYNVNIKGPVDGIGPWDEAIITITTHTPDLKEIDKVVLEDVDIDIDDSNHTSR